MVPSHANAPGRPPAYEPKPREKEDEMDNVERPHGVVASDALLLTPEEAAEVLRVGRTTV
jgi:hypothetical protein